MALNLDSKIPDGPLADKWTQHKFDLKLVNPTATSYREFDLWLNQRYVRRVESLAAGESVTLSIDSFWDERGEGPFPGGWFRYYEPTPIVLVQIEPTPGAPLVGLISKPPDKAQR